MAKYMTRTVDSYIYHLGNIENNGDATTIIPVTDISSEKKLGERETKKLLKEHGAQIVYKIDNVPHTYCLSLDKFMELAEEVPAKNNQ
jgi:hypothetical protein